MIPILSLIAGFVTRTVGLYVSLNLSGFWKLEPSELLLLSSFSMLLGVILPVTNLLDVSGLIFRVAVFCVMLIFVMKLDLFEAIRVVVVAAIIQGIIILVLTFTPFSFLVVGLTPWTIP